MFNLNSAHPVDYSQSIQTQIDKKEQNSNNDDLFAKYSAQDIKEPKIQQSIFKEILRSSNSKDLLHQFLNMIDSLDLSKLKLQINELTILAEVLKDNTSLKKLNLSKNSFGKEGAKIIANAIKSNTFLEELDLGGNNIQSDGAKKIADALKINTSLRKLNLKSNNIKASGIKEIAEVLGKNTSLQQLDLSENNLARTKLAAGMTLRV